MRNAPLPHAGSRKRRLFELVLPRLPEADERLALRVVERGEVVGVGIGQRLARGAGGLGLVLPAQGLEAVVEHAAERLLDDVAGDERRGVERPFLLPPAAGLGRRSRRSPPAVELLPERSRSVIDCSKMWPRMSTSMTERISSASLRVRDFAGGPVIVVGEVAEVARRLRPGR